MEEIQYKYYLDEGIFDIQDGKYESAIEKISKSINLKKDFEISYFCKTVSNKFL